MKTSRKFLIASAFVAAVVATDFVASSFGVTSISGVTCMAAAPNNGSYLRTNKTVSVYNENGHPKGSYAVYPHKGQRYIDFNNTWICIQGKRRFSYCGNWYQYPRFSAWNC